jgi:uncharacterized protein (DUF1800 family)
VLNVAGLTGVGLVAAACAPDPGSPPQAQALPPPGPPPAPVPPTVAAARHLASRATFGTTQATVDRIIALGLEGWVDEQLRPGGTDAESMLAAYQTLTKNNVENDLVRTTDEELLFAELDHATLLRAVFSERQLYEVMCQFWSNHLTIWRRSSYMTHLKTLDDRTVVRTHALGRYADMLLASARSPAMLVYLDNYRSNAFSSAGINENYGRELLELHSLGIINGQQVYTEADVRGVAKIMSGWTISFTNGPNKYGYVFNTGYHSRDAVSILGGAWSRPARSVGQGEADGVSLVNFLARHRSTARYLSWKLARHFVSDDPPMGLVERLADVYQANDTAIAPVLRALFLSAEFQASAGQKVKRPNEWLFSALRSTRATVNAMPKGHAAGRLREVTRTMGEPLHERETPDGYPDRAVDWVSAEGLLKRWEFGARIARNRLTDTSPAEKVVIDLNALLPNPLPATTRDLLVTLADRVFQFPLAPGDADTIVRAVGLNPTGAATTITTNANNLQTCVGLLLAHPTFHRR